MAFLVIEPTAGLSASDRRRAHRVGPAAVAVPTSYRSLLKSAGFAEIDALDLTADYLATQVAWIHAIERRADAMRAILGNADYDDRMRDRRNTRAAIEAGLLSRSMYWAKRL